MHKIHRSLGVVVGCSLAAGLLWAGIAAPTPALSQATPAAAEMMPTGAPPATQPDVATPPSTPPPSSWIDADTGHRVRRLTNEPGSSGLYFNVNAYTPDGKEMVYTAPDGIHVFNFDTFQTRLLVPGNVKIVAVGRKNAGVYYQVTKPAQPLVFWADIATGQSHVLPNVKLPPRANVSSVNADETLLAGTYIEGTAGADYGANKIMPAGLIGGNVQPLNKAKMMEERLAARLPLVLFTINIQTGQLTPLLHSTDWINHLLFSPTDPTLLMYCHEGPWQKVDRIWNIRTDGTHNQLIHKRTMAMEIAGHEFWGIDGKTLWYDLQTPKGEDFFLAGYNVDTGERRWYHMDRNAWSIHFNVTSDESLFCGDGGDPGQVARAPNGEWIELFHPLTLNDSDVIDKGLVQPGVFNPEHLVNMSKHNYRQEPNVRFSPDNKMVIFTGNMSGESYVYAVDVEK